MKRFKLADMTKGWFVGNFEPVILRTQAVEVAVKVYKAGDYEETHYHKIATEVTVITGGEVMMNGTIYRSGDIVVIEPFTATDFKALTDATTIVVKHPGANNDKYAGTPT